MRLQHRAALADPSLLTYETVARALRCSVKTVRRAVDAGEIHAETHGRFRRISKSELLRVVRTARPLGEGSDADGRN